MFIQELIFLPPYLTFKLLFSPPHYTPLIRTSSTNISATNVSKIIHTNTLHDNIENASLFYRFVGSHFDSVKLNKTVCPIVSQGNGMREAVGHSGWMDSIIWCFEKLTKSVGCRWAWSKELQWNPNRKTTLAFSVSEEAKTNLLASTNWLVDCQHHWSPLCIVAK